MFTGKTADSFCPTYRLKYWFCQYYLLATDRNLSREELHLKAHQRGVYSHGDASKNTQIRVNYDKMSNSHREINILTVQKHEQTTVNHFFIII